MMSFCIKPEPENLIIYAENRTAAPRLVPLPGLAGSGLSGTGFVKVYRK